VRASSVHGTSTTPLLGLTIGEALRQTVNQHGEREALVVSHQGYRATWKQFFEQTSLVARGLMSHGGLWSPNSSGSCCTTQRRGWARSW
jgi:fatty-acyl-CoA synthase